MAGISREKSLDEVLAELSPNQLCIFSFNGLDGSVLCGVGLAALSTDPQKFGSVAAAKAYLIARLDERQP